jgi:hypothetical protein
MEVGGQLHAPDTSAQEKEHLVPTKMETDWVPEPVWTLRKRV